MTKDKKTVLLDISNYLKQQGYNAWSSILMEISEEYTSQKCENKSSVGSKYLVVYTYGRTNVYDTTSGIENYVITTSQDVYSTNGIQYIKDYLKKELDYDIVVIQNIIALND